MVYLYVYKLVTIVSMKIKRSLTILSIVVLCFSFSTFAQAQDTQVAVTANGGGVLVASVNIQGVTIVSQEKNKFTLSFVMTNGEGVQSGIHYRVRLVAENKDTQVVMDEKKYDDVVFLAENSEVKKEITYTAPENISGVYQLHIDAQNEKGFIFAVASFGEVTLNGTATGIVITPQECVITLGEKEFVKGVFQGILIAPEESMTLSCLIKNNSTETISATPVFETYSKTTFGEEVQGLVVDVAPISFAPQESKTVRLTTATPKIPQIYKTLFSVKTDTARSNNIEVSFAVKGTMGTIENLSIDKESFLKGETANLSIIWSVYTDDSNKQSTDVTLTASIKNSNGSTCTEDMSQTLPMVRTTPTTGFAFSMTKDCSNPIITVTLTDNEGVVLDTQTIRFDATQKPMKNNATTTLIVISILVIIIVTGFYIKKVKQSSEGNSEIGTIS